MKKQSWFARLLGQEDRPSSAEIAKNRLTVLVASNDRLKTRLSQECINRMKREVAEVISRYVGGVQSDSIAIDYRKEDSIDVLQMSVNLPDDV